MARELRSVFALRQELATMEERNRLARDLHDAVKQQVFAFAMQIGAARQMLDGASPVVGVAGCSSLMAQEARSNGARHSGAREVRVALENRGYGEARLTIADDGCGFDGGASQAGVGLHSMRERAEALPGGWLKIESRVGEGTRIEAGCGATRANGTGGVRRN